MKDIHQGYILHPVVREKLRIIKRRRHGSITVDDLGTGIENLKDFQSIGRGFKQVGDMLSSYDNINPGYRDNKGFGKMGSRMLSGSRPEPLVIFYSHRPIELKVYGCPLTIILNKMRINDIDMVDTQGNWHWCKKCQGLFFAGNPTWGVCPAGDEHTRQGSGGYFLQLDDPSAQGQDDWRWCKRCQGLFFNKNPSRGVCPRSSAPGQGHNPQKSGNYTLKQNDPSAQGQDNWRWCRNCQGLFFAGSRPVTLGVCPAGGSHDATKSGNYTLED